MQPDTFDEQAETLFDAVMLVSNFGAARNTWHRTPHTDTVIAYTRGSPDLRQRGFILHVAEGAPSAVIIPEGRTLFAAAGTTDHIITAATILLEHGRRSSLPKPPKTFGGT